MSYTLTDINSSYTDDAQRSAISDFVTGLANGFAAHSQRRARTDQMRAISRLSDDDLAQIGLPREHIPFHVFRDLFA